MSDQGRYHVSRKIADGGMAEIFLGTQRGAVGFERPVVLKRVRPGFAADERFRDSLIDEAHIAMTLTHSNIAQVLDLGVAGQAMFLVMELIDGWDMDKVRKRAEKAGLPLPPELALFVIAETCRALAYAHAKTKDGKPLGIVHRDISPHNILVSEQGEVKLTDFGVAKAHTKRGVSAIGSIKGKVGYMSPEQAQAGELDGRSDLFSLGTTLYQLTTGKLPFVGSSAAETIKLTAKAEFTPPEKLVPNYPPGLAQVVKRAMQREKKDRYQTAEEMLVDAEKVLRTALPPAGQTELKQYLEKLSAKDGVLAIGKTAPVEVVEISEKDLVLEIAEPSGKHPVHAQPPPAPRDVQLTQNVPAERRGRGGLVLAAVVGGALVVGLVIARALHFGELPQTTVGGPIVLVAPGTVPAADKPGASAEPSSGGTPGGAAPTGEAKAEGASGGESAGAPAPSADEAKAPVAQETAAPSGTTEPAQAVAPSGVDVAGASGPGGATNAGAAAVGASGPSGATTTGPAASGGTEPGGSTNAAVAGASGPSGVNTPAGASGPAAPAKPGATTAAVKPASPSPTAPSGPFPYPPVTRGLSPGSLRVIVAHREDLPAGDDDVIAVQIVTEPAGASVNLLGTPRGETPLTLKLRSGLTYDFDVQKDGHAPLKKRLYLPRLGGQVIEGVLVPATP